MRRIIHALMLGLFAVAVAPSARAAVAGEVIVAVDSTVDTGVLVLPSGGIAGTVPCGGHNGDLSNGPLPRNFARAEPVNAANPPGPHEIVAYDEDCGSRTVLLSDASLGIRTVRWSRDGTRLAFFAERYNAGAVVEQGIYVGEVLRIGSLPITLSNVRLGVRLTREVGFNCAPDTRRVVFNLEQSGQYDIMIASLDTGAVVNVTNSPDDEFIPDFSPSGELIAFEKRTQVRGNFRLDIFTMSSSGGAHTQVTTKSNTKTWVNINPSWSPDSGSIAFSGLLNGQIVSHIYRIRFDGSGKALDLTPDSGHYILNPLWRA